MSDFSQKAVPIVTVNTKHKQIKFFSPDQIIIWRAKTLLTKEPETIQWIDNFNKDETMWDIGSNIGVYTLYAAARGLKVDSFEPAPGNFFVLSKYRNKSF